MRLGGHCLVGLGLLTAGLGACSGAPGNVDFGDRPSSSSSSSGSGGSGGSGGSASHGSSEASSEGLGGDAGARADASGSGGGSGSSSGGIVSSGTSHGATLVVRDMSRTDATGGSYTFYVEYVLGNPNAKGKLLEGVNFTAITTNPPTAKPIRATYDEAPPGCTELDLLPPGKKVTCTAGFKVPANLVPAMLEYDDRSGHTATASLPASTQAAEDCATTASWLVTGDGGCRGCMVDTGECQPEAQAYASACAECASQCSAPASLCACEASCDDARCKALFEAWTTCASTQCAVVCQ